MSGGLHMEVLIVLVALILLAFASLPVIALFRVAFRRPRGTPDPN